jgi:hypothetical protein
MVVESLFTGATIRDRFVAGASRDDETTAQRLAACLPGDDNLEDQRDEAWRLLSAGGSWAAEALETAGVDGTNASAIRDSDAAFDRGQHLDRQLWHLSQVAGYHDAVALLVDAVKRACYRAAELGPIRGGRLASFGPGHIVEDVAPDPHDLQAIGTDLGEALRWYAQISHRDPAEVALRALERRVHPA